MSKPSDIGGKRLISLSPGNWARWLTELPQVKVIEMVNSDLQWVSRENDIALKVTSPDTGDFLLLNELQLRYSAKLPRRMRAYSGLVEEKYQLPVYPILVNILPHLTLHLPRRKGILGSSTHLKTSRNSFLQPQREESPQA